MRVVLLEAESVHVVEGKGWSSTRREDKVIDSEHWLN